MSEVFFPDDPAGVFHEIHIPKCAITWAGSNPFAAGFCFGTENGQIVLTDSAGRPAGEPRPASASEEAVNGVAYSQNWLAVTTRKDINLIGPFLPRAQPPDRITFFAGGLDVSVAPTSGHFVIPLGPDGVMFVKPGTSEKDPVSISRSKTSNLNYCRAAALPAPRGEDVLICAGRRGGVGYAGYRDEIRGHMLHTVTFPDLDLVDVCALATSEKPLAVLAAAKDGTLVFFDDILTVKTPLTVKYKRVKGTVYRVLSIQGDIYLLTSNGLFILFRLATGFLRGEALHRFTTEILRIPIEAADANTVGTKWLLAVGAESVFRFDLEKMPKSSGEASETPDQLMTQPQWEESSLDQKSEHFPVAV